MGGSGLRFVSFGGGLAKRKWQNVERKRGLVVCGDPMIGPFQMFKRQFWRALRLDARRVPQKCGWRVFDCFYYTVRT